MLRNWLLCVLCITGTGQAAAPVVPGLVPVAGASHILKRDLTSLLGQEVSQEVNGERCSVENKAVSGVIPIKCDSGFETTLTCTALVQAMDKQQHTASQVIWQLAGSVALVVLAGLALFTGIGAGVGVGLLAAAVGVAGLNGYALVQVKDKQTRWQSIYVQGGCRA